jgi:ribosome biogenesis GTPase
MENVVTLSDSSPDQLALLGWNDYWNAHYAIATMNGAGSGLVPVRVIQVNRGSLNVQGEEQSETIELTHGTHDDIGEAWPPVVGDWLLVTDDGTIADILPRRSYLQRPTHNRAMLSQPVAANVDIVFAVEPMVPEPSQGRVERVIAMAKSAGLPVSLIVTKRDLADASQIERFTGEFRETIPDIFVTASNDPASYESLRHMLGAGMTAVLIGRSGAGKSTLSNIMTGARQLTGAVRQGDGKGRHTTTARGLFAGPDGIIIDTPGIRELASSSEPDAIGAAFPDITALAQSCLFNDCTHTSEPQCAVVAAVEEGTLDPERLERFQRMSREAARRSMDLRETRDEQHRHSKSNTQGRRKAMRFKGRSN